MADIEVADDAMGSETTALAGTDAALFAIDGTELFLQAGIVLDARSKSELAVIVEVDDSTLGSGADDTAALTITVTDATAPTVTVDSQITADSTPALSGTVDDPRAVISVTVGGQTHSAANHGATWSLADGTLSPLAPGIYDVSVTATDAADNSGSDATTDELEIVTDWEEWRRDTFTATELADPAISGPDANLDGDARDNIFEFLYLSDPMAFDREDPVHSELNGSDRTEWSFVRRIERSGTTLTVRVSDNPDLTGATVLNNPEITPIDAESKTATYTDDTAVTPDAPRYFRIEITVE